MKRDAFKEFKKENIDLAKTKFEAGKLLVINETLSQLLGIATQFVAVFLSAYLVLKGNITLGMLIAIVQLSGSFNDLIKKEERFYDFYKLETA